MHLSLIQPCRRLSRIAIVLLAFVAVLIATPVVALSAVVPTLAPAPTRQDDVPAADRLLKQGDDLRAEGQYEAALARYEQALPLYRQAGARRGEANCLSRIGQTRESLRDHAGAVDAFKLSLPLWRELQDRDEEAWALNAIGWNDNRLGEHKTAQEYYAQALPLFRATGNREGQAYVLHNNGLAQADGGEHPQAIASFQQALVLWRELANRDQEAWALNAIGWSEHELGEHAQALEYYAQALPIFRDIGDREGQAYVLHNSGLAREELGEHWKAIETYQQALPLWREMGEHDREAWALNGIGWNYDQLDDPPKAIDHYTQALSLFRDSDNREGEARVLTNLGWAYHHSGESLKSSESFIQALALWREVKDQRAEAETWHDLAAVYEDLYQFEQVVDAYQHALALWRALGDREQAAWALGGIGIGYKNRFDYDQAVAYLLQSVAAWQALGNAGNEALELRNIGNAYAARADDRQALDYYQRALDRARAGGNRAEEAETINGIGMIYIQQGNFEKGLTQFQQALALWRELDDRAYEARALNNLGVAYWHLGDLARSVDYVKQALALSSQSQAADDQFRSGIWLSNIANYYYDMGDYAQAADTYQRAFTITQQTRGTRRVYHFAVLDGLGLTYAKLQDYPRALDHAGQALAIARELGDADSESSALNHIGEIHLMQGDTAQARAALEQALALRQKVGGPGGELETLANLGRLYEVLGDDDEAIAYYVRAVEVIESIQSEIKVEELKSTFAAKQAGIYERLIDLLWKQQRLREAFDYMERARARAFLDQLAGGVVDFRAGVPAERMKQERELQARVSALRRRLVDLRRAPAAQRDNSLIASMDQELDAREADYAQMLTELKVQSPEVASLVSVDTTPITGVQQLLDADTTLVEYFVTDERTLAFVVTRDSFASVAIDAGRAALADAVAGFHGFASLGDPHPAELQQLYAWLVAPIKPHLRTPLLGIIPHGPLHYLPFAALTDGQRYLGDDYVLFSLPSASVLRFVEAKRKPQADTLLTLGNPALSESAEPLPPLRFAEQEAQVIAGMFGTQPLLGKAASESALRARAAQAGYLHLAAHGQYNPRSPLFSTIYLADDAQNDGRLEVHEVYALDLTRATDLVVLSACQTQVGAVSAGDDVVGLSRAFMYAGTPSVIASLWNVDDAATELLMEHFYMHLKEGAGKGEALRQAQQDIREDYPHPYYWAAFVLTGNAGLVSHPPAAPALALPALTDLPWLLPVAGIALLAVFVSLALILRRRHARR